MGKKKSKLSKNEIAAQKAGLTLKEYKAQRGSSGSGGGGDVEKIAKAISKTFDIGKDIKPFEDTYTTALQTEDATQAEALFKPFYTQKINDTLEDLNTYMETESVSYNRTLRQGRAKMAQLGAAIGTERTGWEGEVKADSDKTRAAKVKETERSVGTNKIKEAGYTPTYQDRLGTVTDEMNSAIEEQKIWYKNQRANRYYSDLGINNA